MKGHSSIAFFLFLTGISLNGNVLCQMKFDESKVQKSCLEIIEQMSSDIFSFSPTIGESGTKSQQYDLFQKLLKSANENELFELTNHSNPIVRCYSFWGLLKTKSNLSPPVLDKNQCDKTVIRTRDRCLMGESPVILIMLLLTVMESDYSVSLEELSRKYSVDVNCD